MENYKNEWKTTKMKKKRKLEKQKTRKQANKKLENQSTYALLVSYFHAKYQKKINEPIFINIQVYFSVKNGQNRQKREFS